MSWPFDCVVIVRHGETEWNRTGRRQGQLDSPLTEEGTRHAETIASSLVLDTIDSIFSSPLGRAYRTALIIGAQVDRSVRVVEDLAEVHHGAFAGLSNDEIEAAHPGELGRREREKYTWTFPEGESYADADARASRALQQVAQAGATTPLLVTHEMIGRMLLRALLELTPAEALAWSLPHGSVIKVLPAARAVTTTAASPSLD